MDSTTKLWRNCSSPSWAYFGSEYVHGVHSVFPAHALQSRGDHFRICKFKIAIPTICKKRKGKERKRKEKAKTKCGLLSLCYMGGHPTPSTSTRGATTSGRSHPIQPFFQAALDPQQIMKLSHVTTNTQKHSQKVYCAKLGFFRQLFSI